MNNIFELIKKRRKYTEKVPGRITAEIRISDGENEKRHFCTVSYKYGGSVLSMRTEETIENEFVVGQDVVVYVNPEKPTEGLVKRKIFW